MEGRLTLEPEEGRVLDDLEFEISGTTLLEEYLLSADLDDEEQVRSNGDWEFRTYVVDQTSQD
ncbi:hypothetical protein [Pseudonocardia sp. H11422]|uniref:hypothetical protein n=1 Tax=Pseudonocardia sp. H11422 TaxID=2835866 RepID=UPI001BDCE105|nr:hypothetical protein [Pseudonocardia sp. H11422]